MNLVRMRSWLISFIVLIVVLGLSLAAGEFAARKLRLSKTYNSYPWRVHAGESASYAPTRNSLGWRDREYEKNKKKGIFRIACIGDSVTEGYGVAMGDAFPEALERDLCRMDYDAEVMNLGISGNSTRDNVLQVMEALEFHPDLIIYQFGLNDIKGFEHAGKVPGGPGAQAVKSALGLRGMLRRSVLYLALAERYNYLRLKLGFKNWAFGEWDITDAMWAGEFEALKAALDGAKGHSKILIVYIPYDFQVYSPRPETKIPGLKLAKFCDKNGYGFLDFTGIFKSGKRKYSLFLDDCHLSPYGNRIVGERLAEFIAENKRI